MDLDTGAVVFVGDTSGHEALEPFWKMLRKSKQTLWQSQSIWAEHIYMQSIKIKTMKRQTYGFRDMEFFKLKIKALHQAKHALVG